MSQERPGFTASLILDTTQDTTKTTAVQVPQWARYGMLYIPNITNAAVSMEMMEEKDAVSAAVLLPNADTNWKTVVDDAESSQIAASGVEDTWVDISNYVAALPKGCYVRCVQGAAETGGAALTYRISFRGA